MGGVIIGGVREDVPGVKVRSFLDDAALRLRGDCRARRVRWVRQVVLHTTKGIPGGRDQRAQRILPGAGPPSTNAERVAKFWSGDPKPSGAHLVVDHDGDVVCLADLRSECAFHAPPVNDISIGIEIYQGRDAEMYEAQLATCVSLVDFLTRRFGIQRQIPSAPYPGRPRKRLAEGGLDVVGVVGHRDVTSNRGAGDPGDAIFDMLWAAGYERFDLDARQDLAAWQARQRELGMTNADGVPGPETVSRVASTGRRHGLWVARPGD